MDKMKMQFDKLSDLFKSVDDKGRQYLYEYETNALLENLIACYIPKAIFLENDAKISDEELRSIPGDRVALKVVCSNISHKSDVGGVKIVKKSVDNIRDTIQWMMADVPENYARILESSTARDTNPYSGISDEKLREAIAGDIMGFLLVQYVPSDIKGFGSELIVGIKNTREFGMIMTAGIGGTDTELYANTFRKGKAFVTASTAMTTGSEFLEMFKKTVSYKKLAGLTRGQKSVAVDDQLAECFSSFISLANYFSLINTDAPYIIEELEINPFVFNDSSLVALDGMCRFSHPEKTPENRPWHKIDSLLHPGSIGIMGVSTTRMNYGRIILNNILASGFEKQNIRIIRPGIDDFDGIACVPDFEKLDIKLDLLVVAVAAKEVPAIVEQVTARDVCESVMLIPGGIGETGESRELAEWIEMKISESRSREDKGPVFLGANCLGVISHPGRYDTLFIPEEKLPKQRGVHKRNVAFVSQSGAFMITRLSKMPELDPAYMISVGNQNDITLGDIISYLKGRDEIDVIAVYAEGFKDMDGLGFTKALKEAVINGKDVIVYKAGKTQEGVSAAGSHTASIAGDYRIFVSCIEQAGGIVASSFTEFNECLMIARLLSKKRISGNRIAALSGAGFEAVGMADSVEVDEYPLKMAVLSDSTVKRLSSLLKEKGLSHLTQSKNPMDLNPGADDEAHIRATKYLAEDQNVDVVIVGLDPLSPVTKTLSEPGIQRYNFNTPGSVVIELPELANNLEKPVIGVIDAGKRFDPMADELKSRGVIIFRSADRAVRSLAVYLKSRLSKGLR